MTASNASTIVLFGPASPSKVRPTSGQQTLSLHMFFPKRCVKIGVLQARAFFHSIALRENLAFFPHGSMSRDWYSGNDSYGMLFGKMGESATFCHFADPFLSQAQILGRELNHRLIDTGASRSVMSDDALHMYRVLKERKLDERLVFYTA